MEMMEGLMTRRSVRKYTDQKIDKATLTEIIRAAQYAPTAHNRGSSWSLTTARFWPICATFSAGRPLPKTPLASYSFWAMSASRSTATRKTKNGALSTSTVPLPPKT